MKLFVDAETLVNDDLLSLLTASSSASRAAAPTAGRLLVRPGTKRIMLQS